VADHDLSTVRPIAESEITKAIASLEQSTAAIEKQNETLRAQRTALEAIMKSDKDDSLTRGRALERRRRNKVLEKGQVTAAVH
jgi:hypothetical protein